MTVPLPVVVLLSGRGSNMHALALRSRQGSLPIDVRAVISDRPSAGGLQLARGLGITTEILEPRNYADRSAFDAALALQVELHAPSLVVLAGYMRILNATFVRQFSGRLLNIHPSLLPKYTGLHTHRRALEAGDADHGASVHFVTEELDGGPVVLQGRVPVRTGDTELSLSARVQQIEHIIYPEAVNWFAQGRLSMIDQRACLDGNAIDTPPLIDLPSELTADPGV